MKKTTKSSNCPGREYFENAAKQIPWPVEVGAKADDYKGVIHVPHYDLDKAYDNLMVSHLVHHGFVIQQTIAPISETQIFNPKLNLKDAKPLSKEQATDEFAPGIRFRLASDGTRFEIESSGKNGITVKYVDGQKFPFKATRDIIKRNLSLGVWIRT